MDMFLVRTDHYALKFLLDQRLSTIPQHTWVSKLFDYDFSVEFNPGRMNTVEDALSRCSEDQASMHLLSTPTFQPHQRGYVQGGAYPVSGAYQIRIQPGYAWDTYPEPLFKSGYGGGWIRVSSTPGPTLDTAQQSIWPI
jgi:hypothetical protein